MDANAVGTQLPSRFGQILLGQLISANMNSTDDQQITMFSAPAKFIVRRIVATNASDEPDNGCRRYLPCCKQGWYGGRC